MKSAASFSLLVSGSYSFGFHMMSREFFNGAEVGLAVIDNIEFQDYSCLLPEPTGPVQNYLKMVEPLKLLLNTTAADGRQTHPLSDFLGYITGSIESIGTFISLLSPNYDSGEFCQGLSIAYLSKQFYEFMSNNLMTQLFGTSFGTFNKS